MYGIGKHWVGRAEASPAVDDTGRRRIETVDLLRGLVIVLMVLDHVRDYFHAGAFLFSAVDPDRSYPALFATRWVTHLCAPVFVLLAGVSARLQIEAGKPLAQVRRLLWTRGLWLIALELTVIGFGFNMGVPILFLQVIWAIGWSMIALAAVVALPAQAVAAIGVVIIAGHNLLDPVAPSDWGQFALAWQFLHEGGPIIVAGQPVGLFAYPVLPWIGVMFLGFGAGRLFLLDQARRTRWLAVLGFAMMAGFFLLRSLDAYGDPDGWTTHATAARTVMDFLNVEKYPPSLLYVLATIGVALMLTPLLKRLPGMAARVLLAYGRVPLFAYVAHIYLVHALMMLTLALSGRDPALALNFMVRVFTAPEDLAGWGFGLPVVFAVWAVVLALLYPLCRWFGEIKRRRRDWWLSYL